MLAQTLPWDGSLQIAVTQGIQRVCDVVPVMLCNAVMYTARLQLLLS